MKYVPWELDAAKRIVTIEWTRWVDVLVELGTATSLAEGSMEGHPHPAEASLVVGFLFYVLNFYRRICMFYLDEI